MKMADTEKTEEFVDAEIFSECPVQGGSAAAVRGEQEEPLKTETTSSPPGEKEGDSPLQTEGEPSLLSMPCLMMELRRNSPESPHASTGSDKPTSGRAYESDSSNPCMLSPSSSGHLADSDTLSSGEEGSASRATVEGGSTEPGADTRLAAGGQTSASSGRKSRRSRSESEMSTNTMAAKKNRCQPAVVGGAGVEKQTNGRLAKVKGHRSQKHKERIRLLRQKREAAARKKYNLLQDSSTSDSDLTCDSSTSSSEDDDETSGGKTITTDIPDGTPVVCHYDISDTDSNQENLSVTAERVRRTTVITHERLKTHRDQDMAANSGAVRVQHLCSLSAGHMEAELAHREPPRHKGHINIPSSDSEVEIVGVQENTRCAHPRGGVIQSLSSAWKPNSLEQLNNSTRQSSQLWTTVSPQPNWVSPPEVVDLTLDEDTRHKYLL
ncbi:protein ARK2N isoform 1-T9 [Salvelinus alpinus]|uniref:protein ARK2N isoform X1 n=1 Tax=Salvelinus alpinus TaxID=8036 RepID=UPI0039FCE1CE